ncbi:YfhO family protein [Eubacterium sp.]
MDITKSGNIIKTNKIFNAQTVAYSLVYSIGTVVFLIIKQMLKSFGLSAGIAMSVSFVAVMLGLFFCEKKFVFAKSINSKPLKQALAYLFRCVVDFGFFKILDFTLNDMLNMSKMLVYIFSAILIFVFNLYFDRLIVFDNTEKAEKDGDTKLYHSFFANRFVLLSMCLATIGILFVFMIFKMFPFGDMTVLRMDLYHQYGPLFVELYDRVTDFKSFLYSWESGGGSSFLGNYFNYLSSPFSFLIFLFDKNQIGYAITFLVIVKGVLSAGTFTYFLKKSFDAHSYVSASFGIFYAFSGYFLAYYWNIMWVDGMIWLPLVALGIENIINKGKCKRYILSLSVLLFSSYYIGYMTCIFSVLYFFVYFIANKDFSAKINIYSEKQKPIKEFFNNRFVMSVVKFGFSSLFVGMLCACFLLPIYFILQSCSATSDSFPSTFEQNFNLIDMLSSHLTGLETTIRSSGEDVLPNIYCGILPAMLLPMYLVNKKIGLKEKASYIFLLLFFIVSFDCNILDFMWHAFHMPNDLPFRYSFLYVFILLVMSFRGLMNFKGIEYRDVMITGIAFIFLVLYFQKNPTNKISGFTIYVSLIFIIVWTLVLLVIKKENFSKFVIGLTIVCMTFCEVIVGDSKSYLFTQEQTPYVEKMDTMANAVNYLKEKDKGFYRTELTYLNTRMDPCIYNYNGISTFSSMAYQEYSQTQYNLGMFGNRINSYTYNTQTPVYNMMYAIKYLIKDSSSLDLSENYYKKIYTTKDTSKTSVYENKYSLPIAFVASKSLENWNDIEGNPFEVQEDLIDKATGVSNVFVPVEYTGTESYNATCEEVNQNGAFFVDDIEENTGASVDVLFKSVKDGNVYIYVTSNEIENINYYWSDGTKTTYQSIVEPYILDLGYHKAGDEIKAILDLNGITSSSTSFNIYAYNIDDTVLESAYEMLSLGQMNIEKHSDTKLEGTINAGYDGYLYTSIPYDEGWKIYIDGHEVKTFEIGESQLASTIKQGKHKIKLVYSPKGLTYGLPISAAAWVGVFGYELLKRIKKSKKAQEQL